MIDYTKYIIKDYTHWSLQIHANQEYLGRAVVWCKREDALDLVATSTTERKELWLILEEYKTVLAKAFQPDWYNYAFLGNEMWHLHGHIVPRYETGRTFAGRLFNDPNYGHHYKTDKLVTFEEHVLQDIKAFLQGSFS